MNERQYKVTYSRLMAVGERLIVYNQIVSESDFRTIATDTTSKFRYILIKAELINYDLRELDSINYVMREEE